MSRHARVGSEDQPGVRSTLGGPSAEDRHEVPHIVGHQGPLLLFARVQEILVLLRLPAPLDGGNRIMAQLSEIDGDDWGVMVIQRQFQSSLGESPLLTLPSSTLVLLCSFGDGGVLIDLICKLGVVLKGSARQPRRDLQVTGGFIDIASRSAKRGHRLVDKEPGTDNKWLAAPGGTFMESDQRMALEPDCFAQKAVSERVSGLCTFGSRSIEQLHRAPR